ncbi:MAG: flagellar basal body rod C-terminal domain-containing protein [Sphingobium sp.]
MSLSGIALGGLRASQMRLTASASNVANAASTGDAGTGDAGSAYRPLRVEQGALPGGGTSARMVADGGTVLRYRPGASRADARGMVAAPAIDLADEAVGRMAAVQSFKANVKVIAVADEMARSALERWG